MISININKPTYLSSSSCLSVAFLFCPNLQQKFVNLTFMASFEIFDMKLQLLFRDL